MSSLQSCEILDSNFGRNHLGPGPYYLRRFFIKISDCLSPSSHLARKVVESYSVTTIKAFAYLLLN